MATSVSNGSSTSPFRSALRSVTRSLSPRSSAARNTSPEDVDSDVHVTPASSRGGSPARSVGGSMATTGTTVNANVVTPLTPKKSGTGVLIDKIGSGGSVSSATRTSGTGSSDGGDEESVHSHFQPDSPDSLVTIKNHPTGRLDWSNEASSAARKLLDPKTEINAVAPSTTFTPTISTVSSKAASTKNDHVENDERDGTESCHRKCSSMGSTSLGTRVGSSKRSASSSFQSVANKHSSNGVGAPVSKKGIPPPPPPPHQGNGGPPSSTGAEASRFTFGQGLTTSMSASNVFAPSRGVSGGSFKFGSKTSATGTVSGGKSRFKFSRKAQSCRSTTSSTSSSSNNQSDVAVNDIAFSSTNANNATTVPTFTRTSSKEEETKTKTQDVGDLEEKENKPHRRRCSTGDESCISALPHNNQASSSLPSTLTWRSDPRQTFSDCQILVKTEGLKEEESNENEIVHGSKGDDEVHDEVIEVTDSQDDEKANNTEEEKLKKTTVPPVQVDTYHVHRCILAVTGRELLNLFQTASQENTDHSESGVGGSNPNPTSHALPTAHLTLKSSAATAFPALLDFIYDQQQMKPLSIHTHSAVALRYLAKRFKIIGLQRAATSFVKSDLNSQTVTTYVAEAELYGDEKVLSASIKLLARNLDQVPIKQLKYLSKDVFCRLVTCPDVVSSSDELSLRVASFLKEQQEQQETLDTALVHTLTANEVLPSVDPLEALYFLKINQDHPEDDVDDANQVTGTDGDEGDHHTIRIGPTLHERCLRATSRAWKDVVNLMDANRNLYSLPDAVANDVLTSALCAAHKEVLQVEELHQTAERKEMELRRVIFRVVRHVLDITNAKLQSGKGGNIDLGEMTDLDELLTLSSSSDWMSTRKSCSGNRRNSSGVGLTKKGGRKLNISVTGAGIQAVNGRYEMVGKSRYTNGMFFVDLVWCPITSASTEKKGSGKSICSSSSTITSVDAVGAVGQKWVVSLQDPDDRYRDRGYDIDLYEAPVVRDVMGSLQTDHPPSDGWVVCGAGKHPAPLLNFDS